MLIGGLAGSFVSYYVAYHTRIGFLWPSAFGLASTLAVASILTIAGSVAGRSRSASGEHLTWSAVMRSMPGEVVTGP